MIKTKKLAAIALACGLISTGFAIFAEKVNAQSASSTANFGGTVPLACAVFTAFDNAPAASSYTQTGTGAAGGKTLLRRTKTASFDCNSDRVSVSAAVTLTQPIPTNATNIIGTHTLDISDLTNGDLTIVQTGAGTFGPAIATTNPNGDIGIFVRSTWISTGEDLLTGAYSASIVVNVTAN